ncbi:MAG: sulfatase-like hydrolase/transferase, partial [Halioglobus sp.]|nr:sulfatase-like hydrolase/transferase [Halioglobus sp.]
QQHGLEDNTLFIFTSDNGSHGMAGNDQSRFPFGSVRELYGHAMNGDWRGIKGEMFEGGHRVPLIVRWPGVVEPGTVSDRLVVLEDIMATVAAIIGAELPPGSAEDSFNLLPYLDGSHVGASIREYAVLVTFGGHPVVRRGPWVLSFHTGTGREPRGDAEPLQAGRGRLHNLRKDPAQRVNFWLAYPEIVRELTDLYEAHMERGSSVGIDR